MCHSTLFRVKPKRMAMFFFVVRREKENFDYACRKAHRGVIARTTARIGVLPVSIVSGSLSRCLRILTANFFPPLNPQPRKPRRFPANAATACTRVPRRLRPSTRVSNQISIFTRDPAANSRSREPSAVLFPLPSSPERRTPHDNTPRRRRRHRRFLLRFRRGICFECGHPLPATATRVSTLTCTRDDGATSFFFFSTPTRPAAPDTSPSPSPLGSCAQALASGLRRRLSQASTTWSTTR